MFHRRATVAVCAVIAAALSGASSHAGVLDSYYAASADREEKNGNLTEAARTAITLKQYDRAEKLLLRSLGFCEERKLPSQALYPLMVLSDTVDITGHYSVCEKAYQRSLEIALADKRRDFWTITTLTSGLIDMLTEQNELSKALEVANSRIKEAREHSEQGTHRRPGDDLLSTALSERSVILMRMSKVAEARAAECEANSYGNRYKVVASRRYRRLLGAAQNSSPEKAEHFLKLAGNEAVLFPRSDTNRSAILRNLSSRYEQQHRLADAESALERALKCSQPNDLRSRYHVALDLVRIYEKLHRPDKVVTLCRKIMTDPPEQFSVYPCIKEILSDCLIQNLCAQGQLTEAVKAMDQALDTMQQKTTHDGYDLNIIREGIATSCKLRSKKQLAAAEKLIKRIVEMQKSGRAPSWESDESIDELSRVYVETNQFAQARDLLLSILKPLAPLSAPENEPQTTLAFLVHAEETYFSVYANRLDRLVLCNDRLNEKEKAKRLYKQHVFYMENTQVENSRVLCERLDHVAQYFDSQGSLPDAFEYFKRAAKIAENQMRNGHRCFSALQGKQPFDCVAVLKHYETALAKAGKTDEAKSIAVKVETYSGLATKVSPHEPFSDRWIPTFCGNDPNANKWWQDALDREKKCLTEVAVKARQQGLP